MAAIIHGNLGSISPAAATPSNLYDGGGGNVVPANRKATGTFSACNTGNVAAKVRFAVIHGALNAVATKDYREYDTIVEVGAVLERTGIPLKAGARLLVQSDVANVAFNFDGIEEDV